MIKLSKRGVQVGLGILWLIDGALQLQHQMFTRAFATQVIAPAAQGQPRFVSGPMNLGIHIFLLHPAVFNLLFALTQLLIGALILWKRSIRLGLSLSVLWGLVVWVFGEGYGGIFSAHTSLLMGAPGAVIIYVLLALAVMPSSTKAKQPIAYWLALVWLVLWVGGGIYQLLPGQNSTTDVSSMIAGTAQGAPSWLASIDTHTANVIHGFGKTNTKPETASQITAGMNMTSAQMTHMASQPYAETPSNPGYLFILALAILQLCTGIGVLLSGTVRKLAIALGITLSLVFWIIGESLGGYYTGLATDPNAGPLFILLGLAILGSTNLDQKLAKLGHKIEQALVGKPNKAAP